MYVAWIKAGEGLCKQPVSVFLDAHEDNSQICKRTSSAIDFLD